LTLSHYGQKIARYGPIRSLKIAALSPHFSINAHSSR